MIFTSKIVCQKCDNESLVKINKMTIEAYCAKCKDIPSGFDDIHFVIDYVYESTKKEPNDIFND